MNFFHKTLRRSFLGIIIVAFVIAGTSWAIQAHASNNTAPVKGYAWSQYLGWIQFSGTTKGGTGFDVQENMSTGALSGYAWSSNIGWISFNGTKVNTTNGVLTGYAHVCAAFANKNSCSGALDPSGGGWDGRIHLSGTAKNGGYYGVVQKSNCTWSGYAWGSDGIGAIHVKGLKYDVAVKTNLSCKITLPSSPSSPSFCPIKTTGTITASPNRISSKNTSVTLTWGISGFDKTNFAAAQCKIVKNGDVANGISITTGTFGACDVTGTISKKVSSQTIYAIYCNGAELKTNTNAPAETVINVSMKFNEF